MKIKKIELNNFKRFTHLSVEDIPETTKLVVLVGPNGSGKTSLMEAMNHYYKCAGYNDAGDYHYLSKEGNVEEFDYLGWRNRALNLVNIDFHGNIFPNMLGNHDDIKGRFYFRSAYRNEPDFQINSMQKQQDPTKSVRLSSLIQNDQTVSANYQRLIASTIEGVFRDENDNKTVSALREELTGRICTAIERVFDDLKFTSVGDPLDTGNFYFTKGTTRDFNYKNLSAGEKSAFDLILDMVIKSQYYSDAIYCIDEPEIHMHTKLQGKVLRELYELVPENSQLWLSTHSIGMLQEAENIEMENSETVVFLDFSDRDFDTDQIIRPSKINKAVMDKFYELAFGDFAKLILPKRIVFCEGTSNGKKRANFDKRIYETIFSNEYPDTFFISGGSCNDIEKIEETNGEIIKTLLNNTQIIKIIDRDDRSDQEVADLNTKGIKVLKKRNLESYLLDDTIIKKLCDSVGKSEEYENCIEDKEQAIRNSIARKNAVDDYKSARSDIFVSIKNRLGLTQCGNDPDTFIRDTLTPLITKDTDIYRQLNNEIFGG